MRTPLPVSEFWPPIPRTCLREGTDTEVATSQNMRRRNISSRLQAEDLRIWRGLGTQQLRHCGLLALALYLGGPETEELMQISDGRM